MATIPVLLQERPADLPAQQVFSRVAPSIVVVEVFDPEGTKYATGSGVVVEPGLVATSKHVVEDAVRIAIVADNAVFEGMIKNSHWQDLVLLEVPHLTLPAVQLRDTATIRIGERAYAVGAPRGLQLTLSDGLVSGIRQADDAILVQTTAAISPGSSGGGLFDAQGRLLGITTFFLAESQSLNFAVASETIRRTKHFPGRMGSPEAFLARQWLKLGKAKLTGDDTRGAERALQEVIGLAPGVSEAWYLLGRTYEKEAQFETVALVWGIPRKGLGHPLTSLPSLTVNAFRRAVALSPGLADAWARLGLALYSTGEWHGAAEAMTQALRTRVLQLGSSSATQDDLPTAKIWSVLGVCRSQLGQYDDAVLALREAVKLDPEDGQTWSELGSTYLRQKKLDLALDTHREAVRKDADIEQSWYELATIYAAKGDRSSLSEAFAELKRLSPERAAEFAAQLGRSK